MTGVEINAFGAGVLFPLAVSLMNSLSGRKVWLAAGGFLASQRLD